MWVYKINKYYITPTLSLKHHHTLLLAVPFARVAFIKTVDLFEGQSAQANILGLSQSARGEKPRHREGPWKGR